MNKGEKIYDEEIAPLLLKALNICKEHGLPMIAAVYYEGLESDASGLTKWHPEERAHPCWYLMRKAWGARGNIDQLLINLSREVKPENDDSVALRMFRGIDEDPTEK